MSDYCCEPDSGQCCGPGSWCCARAGRHEHEEAMTTDPTPLQERIAAELCFAERGDDFAGITNPALRRDYLQFAAAVLPIIAAEVRKAQADAWDEGARDAIHGFDIEDRYTDPVNPYRADDIEKEN